MVFIGLACNCQCRFCPQPHRKPALGGAADTNGIIGASFGREYYLLLLMRLKNAVTSGSIEAIGYSGGEPFLYVDRVKHYAMELLNTSSTLYQYIYTNGVAVTRDAVKALSDVGIKEIRFNLAATDFSTAVLDTMKRVRKHITFLTIEIPALKDTLPKIRANLNKFIDMGVDQINLCEFGITENNYRWFKNNPCYHLPAVPLREIQRLKPEQRAGFRQNPIWSRQVTYDVMDVAAREKWPITINDCSEFNHHKSSRVCV